MKRILVLLALVGSSALGQISPPPGGGGGTGCTPGSTTSILKGNNAGGCVAATPGTDVLTSVSQFAASSLVSATTSGLLAEYHFQEANGAATVNDYSGHSNPGTVVGNPLLTGTLNGGMQSVLGSTYEGYISLPTSLNTAVTFQVYTCLSAQAAVPNPLYDSLLTFLTSATAPSIGSGTLQAYGWLLQGDQGTALGQSIGKYGASSVGFNNNTIATQAGESTDGCHLLTWINGTTNDQFFIDSRETSFYQYQNSRAVPSPISGSYGLGAGPYATPLAGIGHPYPIYFFNAYSRALTAAEITANVGSIQTSMQARGVTKASSVYSDGGNQLLTVGDSITYGLNVTNAWWKLLSTTTPYTASTIATPGWQVQNLIAECQTRGQGSINPNMNTTVTIFAGTNDLAQVGGALGTVTPAVAYQRLRRAVQCYKGLKPQPRVIVFTMMSRGVAGGGSSAANDALKNTYNDLIRKDNAGADAMFDVASFPGLGADGAAVLGQSATACLGATCYNLDYVHPTQSGHQVTANYFSSFINALDSAKNGVRPLLITPATYTEFADDVAVNANPTGASQTITLPDAIGLVGTSRYIFNIQATGTNTVTVAAASGQNIDGSATMLCPNATKCAFRSILGSTLGTSTADSVSGAHWEQFGFSGGGAVSGNATSLQGVAIDPTAPTTGTPVLAYNGTSYIPSAVSGTVVPTATTSVLGIVKPDGTSITISGGTISAAGGGAVSSVFTRTGAVAATTGDYTVAQVTGAAPLASPTFTGTTVISGTALNITAGAIQKGGTGAHLTNGCTVTMAAAATQACSAAISGGSSGSVCGFMATNAAAALVLSGVNPTANGNVPFITWSSATPSLNFSTAIGQQVATGTGATFQILCDI